MDILTRGLQTGWAPATRRQALGSVAALAAAGLGSAEAAAAGPIESRQIEFSDAREKLRAEFRMMRDLAPEADVLMWYYWTVFVVADGHKVVPIARMEGIEFSHHRLIGPELYRVHGHNLSYPRDLHTGAFITRVQNPVTGREVMIPPTVLTQDPGMLYSPAGKRPLDRKDDTFTPTYSLFRIEDDVVKVEQIRIPPDTWPTPFIEASHSATPRRLYEDHRVLRLPLTTDGGFVFPFPKWLEMGDAPGHMFGIWSGRKLDGVHRLPRDFYEHAQREHPALLKVDLTPFDR